MKKAPRILTHKEQIHAFEMEIRCVINRFAHEFDLTLADAIGSLEIIKMEVFQREVDRRRDGRS